MFEQIHYISKCGYAIFICSKSCKLLSFKNNNKYLAEDLNHDLYLKGFLQNLYLRPSCHQCKFCHKNRPTDLTLADFWGVQDVLPEMYDRKEIGRASCRERV